MPLVLKNRADQLTEQMDQPDCDIHLLENTYRQFRLMNPLISRWRVIYKRYIRPRLKSGTTHTLLDIGFGGGDILFSLSNWAKKDGFTLNITGIEIDRRAMNYVLTLPSDPAIYFKHATLESLVQAGEQYDIVISNHLLHHLDYEELSDMLDHLPKVTSKMVLFNDIERSDLAYMGFNLFVGPFLRNSYSRNDGLRSIKRSFTGKELKQLVPDNWKVERIFPYRLVLILEK